MEEKIPESDQWKLGGNCMICRRVKYCHTTCKAQKLRKAAIIDAMRKEHEHDAKVQTFDHGSERKRTAGG